MVLHVSNALRRRAICGLVVAEPRPVAVLEVLEI